MDRLDYNICIIGCRAYGFHLAAHPKRTGHKTIHLGGSTQIFLGIKGKRWEERDDFKYLISDFWVKPSIWETPVNANNVEGVVIGKIFRIR